MLTRSYVVRAHYLKDLIEIIQDLGLIVLSNNSLKDQWIFTEFSTQPNLKRIHH